MNSVKDTSPDSADLVTVLAVTLERLAARVSRDLDVDAGESVLPDDPSEVGALPVALMQPTQHGVHPPVPLDEFARSGAGSRQTGGEDGVGHRVNRGEVQVTQEHFGGIPDARLFSHRVADAGHQVEEAALRGRVNDLNGI